MISPINITYSELFTLMFLFAVNLRPQSLMSFLRIIITI